MISLRATAEAGTRFAGFQMTALPEGERRGDLPYRRRGREIPGADHRDGPDRLAANIDSIPRPHAVGVLAELAQRLGRVVGEKTGRRGRPRPGPRPSGLPSSRLRSSPSSAARAISSSPMACSRRLALFRTGLRPLGLGLPRRGNGIVQLAGTGLRIAADQIREIRRVAVLDLVLASPPRAGNEVSALCGHAAPPRFDPKA